MQARQGETTQVREWYREFEAAARRPLERRMRYAFSYLSPGMQKPPLAGLFGRAIQSSVRGVSAKVNLIRKSQS